MVSFSPYLPSQWFSDLGGIMKRAGIVIASLSALVGGTASAQDSYHWPAPTRPADIARMAEFPMGTPLAVVTRTEVNTKQMKPGDRVYLDVAENLSYRGQIIVPVGSPVVAEVGRSERNGHFGKRGTIELRMLYAQTPSGPVRLTGNAVRRGTAATAWSVPAMILLEAPVLALVHGTSGYIRQGTPITAYMAEPLLFTPQPPEAQTASVARPDDARPLPARFDPSTFGRTQPTIASR